MGLNSPKRHLVFTNRLTIDSCGTVSAENLNKPLLAKTSSNTNGLLIKYHLQESRAI